MLSRIAAIAQVVWYELLRKKDLYVLLILMVALLFYLMSVDAFGLNTAVRYLKDVGILIIWLFSWIISIGLASRQLPNEERRGTIFPLLAKPVTRTELILGKWLGSWVAATTATLLFYLTVILVVFLRSSSFDGHTLLQAVALHVMLLGVITAIALLFSSRLNFDAAATLSFIVCLVCFAIIPSIPEMLVHAENQSGKIFTALYYALPHFELFDLRRRLVHDWGPAPWKTIGMVIIYGAVWTGILLTLTTTSYRQKRFRRENVG